MVYELVMGEEGSMVITGNAFRRVQHDIFRSCFFLLIYTYVGIGLKGGFSRWEGNGEFELKI